MESSLAVPVDYSALYKGLIYGKRHLFPKVQGKCSLRAIYPLVDDKSYWVKILLAVFINIL